MRYTLAGLNCAACAARIEQELRKIKGLEEVAINLADPALDLPPELVPAVREAVARLEPGVRLVARAAGSLPEKERAAGERKRLYLLGAAALLLAAGFVFRDYLRQTPFFWAEHAVFGAAYLLVGGKVIYAAFNSLFRGKVFDENFLLTLATAGAIAIHRWTEAVAVMLFYAAGEYLQDRAVSRSRRSIAALLEIRPDYANLLQNGKTQRVLPEEVAVGQLIVVRPGERVPLDGEVVGGSSFVDASALTGEPVPREVGCKDKILAGMINGPGFLAVRVTRPYRESSAARILDLVEKAAARKAPTEQFITAFARSYTPAVVLGALLLAFVPPLVFPGAALSEWVYRALVLLVISCPCALVISVPLGYFAGIGAASRRGILVKGANFLDALASLHTVVFDKTGTLTKGIFRVKRAVPANGFSEAGLLALAACAGACSNHPVARSIREACGREIPPEAAGACREIPGHGIAATVGGRRVLVGSERLLRREGISCAAAGPAGTGKEVYVAVDGIFAGYLVISDEPKPDAAKAVASLKGLGIRRAVLLTGDGEAEARRVAGAIGLDAFSAGLLPEDKVRKVEELLASLPDRRRQKLAFVGDGINDAPVLARADVGVAMGALGSDAAVEAADVVLMEDAPSRLADAVRIARRTRGVVRQNVVFVLGVKVFFLALGAFGAATIWEAVFADVGVALLAIFNAARVLQFGGRQD